MESSPLPYEIIACSNEDPQYPITSIQNASIRSNGWQTKESPVYPVQFEVDLGAPADVTTIQFVSHQSKIPCRVNLSYANSPGMFKPLGSFQFSDNSQTGYSARELKSVNLSKVKARYFRVSIRGCHTNASNPYSQVGLVSLKFMGTGGRPITSSSRPQTAQFDLPAEIDKLERLKHDAVEREDFEEAARVKAKLDILREKRDRLEKLQQMKNDAIAREDFAAAKQAKEQIENLLSGRSSPSGQNNYPMEMNSMDSSRSNKMRDMPVEERPLPKRRRAPSPPPQDDSSDNDDQPPPPRRVADTRPIRGAIQSEYYEEQPPPPPPSDAYLGDERPIHGVHNDDEDLYGGDKDNEIPENANDESGDGQPDELRPADRQEASLLIAKFGEEPVACFFSKGWQLRLRGIRELGRAVAGLSGDSAFDAFACFCKILRHRVGDIQKVVVADAVDAVERASEATGITGADLGRAVAPMLPGLVARIGGQQQQITDAACEFLVFLCKNSCAEAALPSIFGGSKKPAAWKAVLARVNCLHEIILEIGLDAAPGLNMQAVMGLAVSALESAKAEVRSAATELVVSMEQINGSAVLRFLEPLPKRTKSEVERAIERHKEESGFP